MPFAGMDDTAQQSLIDKLDQRLAKRKEQQAREEEKAKEREKLENARRNKEALHAKLLEVAGSGRRVAALDDLNLDDEEIKMFTRALSQKAEELAATAAEMAALNLSQRSEGMSQRNFLNREGEGSEADGDEWAVNGAFVTKAKLDEKRIKWPEDPPTPPRALEATARSQTGTETERSYRFTPREEREVDLMALRRRQRAERVMPLERMRERALASRVSDGRTGVLELTLRHNHVGSKGMAYLAAAMRKNAQLQLLALQANPIGDTGAALLGRVLTTHRGLTELGLQHCGISSRGVKHLAAGLAHNRTLRRLWLLGNKAKDDGAAHLAGTLRRCGVVALGLERNGVGRKGAEALATALASPGLPLQWLRLQHNDVGEHGGAALARALRNNRALTKLQLRECGLGEAGCVALAESLRHNGALRHLGLEENGLSLRSTQPLLASMRAAGTLGSLALDHEHGGLYHEYDGSTKLRETAKEEGVVLGRRGKKERTRLRQAGVIGPDEW